MQTMREDADTILKASLAAVLPDAAVGRALAGHAFGNGKIRLVAVGKAAWRMAKAAEQALGSRIEAGIVLTKYGYAEGPIADYTICEAGHPVPDEAGFAATEQALALVQGMQPEDTVLFLLSGGGSALFEKPLVPPAQLAALTEQLLACGADIVEINTLRKRLSGVKGGRFARLCAPAKVYTIVLSDIVGDPLDMIASGPACPDSTTCAQAAAVVKKYALGLTPEIKACLAQETPKHLDNVETTVTGSVRELCRAAAEACRVRGYSPLILTDSLTCEAREAGAFLAAAARYRKTGAEPAALIAGGETIVHVRGSGKGGRNQELALAAAQGIAGLADTAVFSFGSDGTDGPTDAAGGYVDGKTAAALAAQGIQIPDVLARNDAYSALKACGGLILTGATGTNVNDVSVALIRP